MVFSSQISVSTSIQDKRSTENWTFFIYVVSLLSAIGGFLFGYDTGVVSGAMVFIKDQYKLDSVWQELIVSATIFTAWIFSMIAGYVTDKWGRKPVILFASLVFTVGSVLLGLAWSKWMLLGGRLIVGAAIGLASSSVPMYIAEIAPVHMRGKLVTVNQIFITAGLLMAAIIAGLFSSDDQNGWRYMLGLGAAPSILQFAGFIFMPESPRWLIRYEKYEEAFKILKRIRHANDDIDDEFNAIKENCQAAEREKAQRNTSIWVQILKNSSVCRALFVGCMLQMVQQLSGINTVMYYSATIIQMSGIRNKGLAVWLAAALAGVNFMLSFVGFYLVEKIGRRLLTLLSLAGVIISLFILAVGFQLTSNGTPSIKWNDKYNSTAQNSCFKADSCFDCLSIGSCGYCYFDNTSPLTFDVSQVNGTCLLLDPMNRDKAAVPNGHLCENGTDSNAVWSTEMCPSKYSIISLIGLMFYLFFFAPGMGPMPWTISSEIYPLWAKSVCFSISTAFNWLFNLLVSLTFLTLTEIISKQGTFYLYTALAMFGWIFFLFKLPETKGKTLEQMESLFSKGFQLCGDSNQSDITYHQDDQNNINQSSGI